MKFLEHQLDHLRAVFNGMPDPRRGRNRQYSLADIGLAAFSVFQMQSPSFLAHQRLFAKCRGRSNAHTLFGLERMPSDNHIRKMLDNLPTEPLGGLFTAVVGELNRTGVLDKMRVLDGQLLIALDGTEYFSSYTIGCDNCSVRQRSNGGIQHFHQMLGAAVVTPGRNMALPLAPEFLAPRVGQEKQDCEREAAKRWQARLGPECAWLRPIYLGDDLYACQPLCQAIQNHGSNFLLTAKPSSHKTLYEYLDGVQLNSHQRTERFPGGRHHHYHYRWLHDLPLREGKEALRVNWFEIEIKNSKGEVTYRSSFVTDLGISEENVVELAECARARWKIENECFNNLKTKGYNLTHNFGHGKTNLSSILATLNLFAYTLHTGCELVETCWQLAREQLVTHIDFFRDLKSMVGYQVFKSWSTLMRAILSDSAPQAP